MALSLTVLGTGGPIANPRRASSGYLVAIDGAVRILVDAGGGVYERLGRAGADLGLLELVLVTHTHIDHTGELPAVLFDLYMNDRKRPIAIAGPAGRDQHPGCRRFTDLLFGETGAWSYLHTFDGFGVVAHELPSSAEPSPSQSAVPLDGTPLGDLDVTIRSVAVRHGMMPSVAYRIQRGEASITFSGDVAEASPALVELARGTSMLVHDFALPDRDVPHGNLHAKPFAVGQVARDAGVQSLLVTHFMPAIEDELDAALASVRRSYAGPLLVPQDLQRFEVG